MQMFSTSCLNQIWQNHSVFIVHLLSWILDFSANDCYQKWSPPFFTNWSRQRLKLSEDLLSEAVTFCRVECFRWFQRLLQRRYLFFFKSSSGGSGGVTEQWTRKWHFKVIVASARCRGLSLTGVRKKEKKTNKKKINIGCNASISSKGNWSEGEAAPTPALQGAQHWLASS